MGEKTVVYNKCNGYKKRNEMKFYTFSDCLCLLCG